MDAATRSGRADTGSRVTMSLATLILVGKVVLLVIQAAVAIYGLLN